MDPKTRILMALKSPATWTIVLTGIVGALNAVIPLADPKLSSVFTTIIAIVGAVLHNMEKHDALMTPPPQDKTNR